MFFADIPGLDEIKQLLVNSVARQHVAHAQLFMGRDGSGALPMALAYAAYLNCSNRTETDSCGTCPNCSKIHKHVHPDVHYIMPVTTTKAVPKEPVAQKFLAEWRSFLDQEPYGTLNDWTQLIGSENKQASIPKEESRQLIRSLSLKAFEADFKVMIIWLPELMHQNAANALLKILEEPPAKTVFLLVTHDPDKLLTTIRSRCQLVHVRGFSEEEIAGTLQQKHETEPETARQIAQLAEGSMRAAEALTGEVTNNYFAFFLKWMRMAYRMNVAELLLMGEEFQKMGRENQKNFLQFALTLLRKTILASAEPTLARSSSAEEQEFIRNFAPLLHLGNREQLVQELNDAHYHIERNANPKILFTDVSLTVGQLLKRKAA